MLARYLESLRILENNMVSITVQSAMWSRLVKIVTMIMIIPFILSMIVEIMRQKPEIHVSKASVTILGLGFIVLLIGTIIIVGMMNCSVPNPLWQCGKSS